MKGHAVLHVAPRRVEWRETDVPDPVAGQLLVRTEVTAISPGTEAMIFRGEFPSGVALDDTIAALRGQPWSYPLHYGYALVGRVIRAGARADETWLGRRVFLFHPHQDYVCATPAECLVVPDDVASRAAVLLPNVEAAVNFVMDAAPLLGERFLVLGQGVVGLLTAAILRVFPLALLAAVDPEPERRRWSSALGIEHVAQSVADLPAESGAAADFDGVIELSGRLDALNAAIPRTGFDGRIIIGSWYGQAGGRLDLSGAFHRRRIRLVSSQVSTLAPQHTGRWTKSRRLALAWDWIRRIGTDRLITHSPPVIRCQEAFELAAAPASGALQVVLNYA